uniref:RWP-RK domain-containing protein n=1 Tax=Hanusia phi TaxID=3032 RepID=A0A7S0HNB0_9CRYP|mmetsp:Transcript_26159/g.59309  ORF Transcript_26159/g.59309 Transcript_26159/m.59309 type:complete len:252 (+) Transcript_26159:260-1015(+)|eukprot:752908-Hanusia_phi.AAC.2
MRAKLHFVVPRRKRGESNFQRQDPIGLDRSAIQKLFHLRQKDAADHLGISLTALKNACRALGVNHWPYSRKRENEDAQSTEAPQEDGAGPSGSSSSQPMNLEQSQNDSHSDGSDSENHGEEHEDDDEHDDDEHEEEEEEEEQEQAPAITSHHVRSGASGLPLSMFTRRSDEPIQIQAGRMLSGSMASILSMRSAMEANTGSWICGPRLPGQDKDWINWFMKTTPLEDTGTQFDSALIMVQEAAKPRTEQSS